MNFYIYSVHTIRITSSYTSKSYLRLKGLPKVTFLAAITMVSNILKMYLQLNWGALDMKSLYWLCAAVYVAINDLVNADNRHEQDRFTVKTIDGLVGGIRAGKGCRAFLGIPYASPPLTEYRFKSPQPPTPWGNDTVFRVSCAYQSFYKS